MSEIINNLFNQGFHIVDNFLDQVHYQKLRKTAEELHHQGHFRQAKIGLGNNAAHHNAIRNDTICWLDEESEDGSFKAYFRKLRDIARMLNEAFFLNLIELEAHFAIFNPNSFYKKHIDQFINAKNRKISCVYYLNTHWQESFGGQLKLYDDENQLLTQILPQSNRFICFRSELPHEVSLTQEIRYSIAAWMKTRSQI